MAIVNKNKEYVVFQMADSANDTEHGTPISAPSVDEQFSNVSFIVRAVNCHDELVAACEAVIKQAYTPDKQPGWSDKMQKALQKARLAVERAKR